MVVKYLSSSNQACEVSWFFNYIDLLIDLLISPILKVVPGLHCQLESMVERDLGQLSPKSGSGTVAETLLARHFATATG